MVLVEPEGRALLAAEATAIITEAARRPLEGVGKVIICDRFHTATPAVAASLLKTVEEPPPGVTIVLLADDVPPGHLTVASRCVTVRFPAPSPEEMYEWVIRSGVPPEVAGRAARALGCDPGGAGDLVAAGNLAERLEAWWSIPERLDGTGARVATLVDGLRALIEQAAEAASGSAAGDSGMVPDPVDGRAGVGRATAQEDSGLAGSTASARRRSSPSPDAGREVAGDMGAGPVASTRRSERERSDRRRRRARDAELRFGFAVLAERYRELLDVETGERPDGAPVGDLDAPDGEPGDVAAGDRTRLSTGATVGRGSAPARGLAADDRPRSSTAASGPPAGAIAEALALLRESAAALVRNPDEKLLLQNLLLHLPRFDEIDTR